jgi:hydroxypyruvate isomerase
MTDEHVTPIRRRDFVRSTLATGALMAGLTPVATAAALTRHSSPSVAAPRNFHLAYAPHFGMFKAHAGDDLVAQLEFMRSEGFTALEDNGMKSHSVADQELIGRTLQRLGMQMGVFIGHEIGWNDANLTTGDITKRDAFLSQIRDSIPVAKRVNAKWMTVVPGHIDMRLDMGYQTANVIESLKQASALLEPHGIAMVIEALNTQRDHPGQFLTHAAQSYAICKAVGSPSCKMLFDAYHMQISEGNLIPNLDKSWSEIGYFQIGDNPGRKEPGTGEVNWQNVFKHLSENKFTGVLGMEHGNSRPGKEGERAVIDAYIAADRWS